MKQNPITLEALIVLDAIEARGSYSAAAEYLDKVPSALSYVVQKLEEQLDVTLFQKQGRRAVLTPAGRLLVEEGRKMIEAADRLAEKTREVAKGWEPRIAVAIDSLLDPMPVFEVMQRFLSSHPDIELDITEEVLNGGWEALEEDRVDLLIGAPDPVPGQKGIRAVPLPPFDGVFVVAKNHPLARWREPVTREVLKRHRVVVVHDSARNSVPWSRGVLSDRHFFYVSNTEMKIKAQVAGIGCGFLPKHRIRHYLDTGELVEVAIEEDAHNVGQQNHQQRWLAWKVVNHGKGMNALRKMLETALSGVVDESADSL